MGAIISTTNSGTTWTTQNSGTSRHLIGVSFTDVNNGTAVGLNKVQSLEQQMVERLGLPKQVEQHLTYMASHSLM